MDAESIERMRECILKLLRAELARQDKKPLTWNERINQMTVEEKVEFLMSFENCANSVNPSFKCYASNDCDECLKKFLNSPYTEGGHR